MIKLESGNISSDYTHYGSVSTDHKTVGGFMTEAIEKFKKVKITINDNCTYDFKGGEKVRITDDTEIESARYVDDTNPTTPLRIYIKTKPKPKYKICFGWVNVWRGTDGVVYAGENVFQSKEDAEQYSNGFGNTIDVIRIEWKEETE